MSFETTRKDLAYPKSRVDAPLYWIFYLCGGKGAGECAELLGTTEFVYPIRVSKFLTFNRSLLIRNPNFPGVHIFSDAGSDGFCAHTTGALQQWWLAFSDDGVLTPDEIMERGTLMPATTDNVEVEVGWEKLPQPILQGGGANPDWQRKIYVHIYWGNASFVMTQSEYPLTENSLVIVKHNQDIKK